MKNPFIDKLTGPVIPLPTPFHTDESIDLDSLGNYVTWLIDNGIKNVMTTVGTSRYNLLSHEEIRQINRIVAQAAKNTDAISIVSSPIASSTKVCIDLAKDAEAAGADIVVLYHPERYYGEEAIYEFYKTVAAEVNIGLMLHEMPLRNGLGGGSIQHSIPLLKRIAEIPNVVAIKEEALNAEYSVEILNALVDQLAMVGAGGGMSRYLRDCKLGAKTFLGGIGGFYPKLEIDFFNAMIKGDFETGERIVSDHEKPYFNLVVPHGWHPTLKAALAVKGLMGFTERRPMPPLPKEVVGKIQDFLEKKGWL